ncbi:MAG: hypothetical protein ACRC7O_05335 [Fimbriiglobus sp.]
MLLSQSLLSVMEALRMARAVDQIIADIRDFQPVGGNWRRLDDLLGELWATNKPDRHIPDLLAVLERFPTVDGAGVLWSVVHGVESFIGYEPELIRSVRTTPSELGVMMVGRLLNAGVMQVGSVSLLGLL